MAQLYFLLSARNAGKSTALLQSHTITRTAESTVVYTGTDDAFYSSRIVLSSPAKANQKLHHCVLVASQFNQTTSIDIGGCHQLDICPQLCHGLRVGSHHLLAY